jgi:predicted CopG family antitoxin
MNERPERLIWLPPRVVDRLRALRGRGESYSDVILRLVETDAS